MKKEETGTSKKKVDEAETSDKYAKKTDTKKTDDKKSEKSESVATASAGDKSTSKKADAASSKETSKDSKTVADAKAADKKSKTKKPMKLPKLSTIFTRSNMALMLWVASVVILLGSSWLWYQRVYLSPRRVFWSAFENNIASRGVTRTIKNSQNPGVVQQLELSFVGKPSAHTTTTVEQDGDKIVTELLGFTDGDFVRYATYEPDSKKKAEELPDLKEIVGQWATSPAVKNGDKDVYKYLYEGLFGSMVMPFGNLSASQRDELVKYTKDQGVYKIDYSKVSRKSIDGHNVYVYFAEVYPNALLNVLQKYAVMLGFGELEQLKTEPGADDSPISINFIVDVYSKQLRKIATADGGYEQAFTRFGVAREEINPEAKTTLEEIQKKIKEAESRVQKPADASAEAAPADDSSADQGAAQ